jgi:hypothetical protein
MRPAEAASGEDVRACRYAAYRTRHATIDAALKPGGSIGTSMVGRLRGNSAPTVGIVNPSMKRKIMRVPRGATFAVIASEAKQSSSAAQHWIASSLRSSQ